MAQIKFTDGEEKQVCKWEQTSGEFVSFFDENGQWQGQCHILEIESIDGIPYLSPEKREARMAMIEE